MKRSEARRAFGKLVEPSVRGPLPSHAGGRDYMARGVLDMTGATIVQIGRLAGNQAVTALLSNRDIAERHLPATRQRLRPSVDTTIVQRFGEIEHKAIGDLGTNYQQITLVPATATDPGLRVTHGDLVALGGDYFDPFKDLIDRAMHPGLGKGTRGEVLYALHVRVQGQDEGPLMGKEFDESAKKAVNDRATTLDTTNLNHFPNPVEGDRNRSQLEKSRRQAESTSAGPARPLGAKGPLGAGGEYRQAHETALGQAATLGRVGAPIDPAMAVEAFGEHFLTDSFSAGHVRTERKSIFEYWNEKVPMFFYNFKGYLAEYIAKYLDENGNFKERRGSVDFKVTEPGYDVPVVGKIPPGTRAQLASKLKDYGELSFGAVVAIAVHDYDGERGVEAKSGQTRLRLVGDNLLLADPGRTALLGGTTGSDYTLQTIGAKRYLEHVPTMNAATAAVRASVAEVRRAYELGKAGRSEEEVKADLAAGGLYAAEALMPVAVADTDLTDDDKSLRWKVNTVDDLLKDPAMLKALSTLGNNKAAEFLSLVGDTGSPAANKAIERFADELRGGPTRFPALLRRIINWTPDTGGGIAGRAEDDNALDYYHEAQRKKVLDHLTFEQRRRLIQHVITGWTGGEEETMIVDLLVSSKANTSELVGLINIFGWTHIYNKVGEVSGKRLVETVGAEYWSTQGYVAKEVAIGHLLGDADRFSLAALTIMVILRTCKPGELRRLANDLRLSDRIGGVERDELHRLLGAPKS